MAGHSKWSQIKRAKAVKDAKKGANFAQRAREIMVAAKLGGADPETNFRLRTAIDKAKTDGVPSDNIKRAIEKSLGSDNSDELDEMTYEGYGPSGVAVFIEAVTDNKNRTAGDIRSYFNKCNGNLGADGCVSWIFEQKGLIKISQESIEEVLLFEKAVEAGVTDFKRHEEELCYELYTAPQDLNAVCEMLSKQSGILIASAEFIRIPQNTVTVEQEDAARMLFKLLGLLDSHDDIQNVYANFEMDDELLNQFNEP